MLAAGQQRGIGRFFTKALKAVNHQQEVEDETTEP
jgi:hypothetical protein